MDMEAFKTPADVLSALVTRCVNAGMRSRRRKYGRRRQAWYPASAEDMTSAVCALRCVALRSAHHSSARVPAAGWCAKTVFWLDAAAAVRFSARVLTGAARLAEEKPAPGRLDCELELRPIAPHQSFVPLLVM